MRRSVASASLEWLVTDEQGFALTTATPLQRAITRAVQGRPIGDVGSDPIVLEAFGGRLPTPGQPPREVVLLAGIRGGKTLISTALATYWSQHCDLSTTRESDTPRINIASVDKDKARVALQDHLLGTMQSGRIVSTLYLYDGPESVVLQHPSSRPIEIRVVAGRRAGSSLISRWSAGTIFDEATRMVGSDEGVINLDDMRAAVLGRLLPGAQCVYIGSPYAPFGPVYELYSKHFGNPSPHCLVIKARGPDMNPSHFTPELCDTMRLADPDAYRTDVLGEFLTPEEALFPHIAIDASLRRDVSDIGPEDGVVYSAAMDPATRGNAWTLIISAVREGKRSVVLAREWKGSPTSPVSPAVVLHEVAGLCHRYKLRTVATDQHSFDALRDLASMSGLDLVQVPWTDTDRSKRYLQVRAWLVDGSIEIPALPPLVNDLRRVNRKASPSGIRVLLPETGDGRHCDFAPALVLSLTRLSPDIEPDKPKVHPDLLRMRKADASRYGEH